MNGDGSGERRGVDLGVLLIGLALAAASAAILWMVFTAPAVASYARIGPQAAPAVIGFCLAVLSAFTLYSAFRGESPEREPFDLPPMLWIAGGLVAQMLLLKSAGFSIATGLLFAATARGFGRGPLWMTIPIGVALAFVVYFLFAKGLKLSLPAGVLERAIFG